MDKRRIKQVAKIVDMSEDVVKMIFTAELMRAARELMSSDRKSMTGIYGDLIPISPSEYDVCQTKLSQDFIDIIEGNTNEEVLKSL